MTDDTTPYFLADLFDDADDPPRNLLADIADHLQSDAVVIAVIVGFLLAVLSMAAGSWLFTHADPGWIAAHPVVTR